MPAASCPMAASFSLAMTPDSIAFVLVTSSPIHTTYSTLRPASENMGNTLILMYISLLSGSLSVTFLTVCRGLPLSKTPYITFARPFLRSSLVRCDMKFMFWQFSPAAHLLARPYPLLLLPQVLDHLIEGPGEVSYLVVRRLVHAGADVQVPGGHELG